MDGHRDSHADRKSPTLAEAVGGAVGIAEASVPVAVYVVAYTVSGQDAGAATIVAVATALLLVLLRIARRQSPRRALSGLVAVAFAAFLATRTGRAEDFFLPGLLANVAYATAFLVSIILGRPLVGEVWTRLTGEGKRWREDPRRFGAFTRVTWLWFAVFVLRLMVQVPLYLGGAVVALGVARTAMGLPLFALVLGLTYRLLRPTSPRRTTSQVAG